MENPMKEPKIEKVMINIGVGEGGEKLIGGEKVIELLTKRKPIRTISKTTNKDLGIRKGMPIGCKVTLRGKDAENFLKEALWVRDNRLPEYLFGNGILSFGIPDYTDFKEMKYDPEIGIFGMDVNVVLERRGFRIKRRRRARSKIPKKHRINKNETIDFIKNKFNIEVY